MTAGTCFLLFRVQVSGTLDKFTHIALQQQQLVNYFRPDRYFSFYRMITSPLCSRTERHMHFVQSQQCRSFITWATLAAHNVISCLPASVYLFFCVVLGAIIRFYFVQRGFFFFFSQWLSFKIAERLHRGDGLSVFERKCPMLYSIL